MDSSMSNQEGLAEDVALSTCKQGLEPLMHTEAGSAFELPVAIGLPALISLRIFVAVTLQADAALKRFKPRIWSGGRVRGSRA